MNPAATDLSDQLQAPGRTGRDLALLRTRLYRFSNDPRWYVLAESLEERFLDGRQPTPSTMATVRVCLDKIRQDGNPPEFDDDLTAAEDVDIDAGLDERAPYRWQRATRSRCPGRS